MLLIIFIDFPRRDILFYLVPAVDHQLDNHILLHLTAELLDRRTRLPRLPDELRTRTVPHPLGDIVQLLLDLLVGNLERLPPVVRDHQLAVDEIVHRLEPDRPDRLIQPVAGIRGVGLILLLPRRRQNILQADRLAVDRSKNGIDLQFIIRPQLIIRRACRQRNAAQKRPNVPSDFHAEPPLFLKAAI